MVNIAEGTFLKNPAKKGDKTYDRFLIYVPTKLAQDSAFPFPWPAPTESGNTQVTLRIEDRTLVVYRKEAEAPLGPPAIFQLPQASLEELLSPLIDVLLTLGQLQEYITLLREAHYATARHRLHQDRSDAQFGPALPPALRMSLATSLEGLLDFYLDRYHADPLIQFLQEKLAERPEEG